jgi:hypothetical protein
MRRCGGTGLGLTNASNLVEMMSSRISQQGFVCRLGAVYGILRHLKAGAFVIYIILNWAAFFQLIMRGSLEG